MRTAALHGDSITGACRHPRTNWFRRADLRFRFRIVLNNGRGSDTTRDLASRVDPVIAAAPSVCVVQGGGNDLVAGISPDETIENLAATYRRLMSAGIAVVATTVLPHGDVPPEHLAHRLVVNDRLRSLPGVMMCDWADALDLPNLTSDGTHPNVQGVKALARRLAPVLASV